MKLISKINSISSLNDKNFDKFSCNFSGNSLITSSFDNSNFNNNLNFVNPNQQQDSNSSNSNIDVKKMMENAGTNYQLPVNKDLENKDDNSMNLIDTQVPSVSGSHLDTLGSVKSLKFNNNGDSSLFWDSLHKTGASSLRNTVSSSNLSSGSLNFIADVQKYHYNQSQTVGQQQQQQQQQKSDEQLTLFRKNSLPHNNNNNNLNSSASENTDNIKNNNSSGNSFKEITNNNDINHSVVKDSKNTSDLQQIQQQSSPLQQQQQQNQQNGTTGADKQATKWPMVASPHQVMLLYMNKLTPYEHHEIYKYPHIYFIGANAKKRSGIGPNNSDYDNEQGSYIHIPHDHVAYRYEVLKIIGKGSFGQVVKAYDHKTREHVALKMVRNEKRFHRQAQEEIRILQHLRKQDKENTMNIIHMYDYFVFRNHMCITFELLHINLYELIKKNKFQGFSLQLVRKFAHSLLQCLDALTRYKLIHW
jgi:hypothetical protein